MIDRARVNKRKVREHKIEQKERKEERDDPEKEIKQTSFVRGVRGLKIRKLTTKMRKHKHKTHERKKMINKEAQKNAKWRTEKLIFENETKRAATCSK